MPTKVHTDTAAGSASPDRHADGSGEVESAAELLERAGQRERELAAHADLYERIHAFMESLSKETYAAYDAVRDKPECTVLMAVHRTVLQIKADYRGLIPGNREDAEIYAKLREAALLAKVTAA